MSFKPRLREQRQKSTNTTTQKIQLSFKGKAEESKIRIRNPSISLVTNPMPKFHAKVLSLANEDVVTSRRKLGGLLSTRTSKKINLSMYSPSNNILNTNRVKKIDSFSFTNKKNTHFPMTAEQVLENNQELLSEIEKFEILDYRYIYYIGSGINKINTDSNLPN